MRTSHFRSVLHLLAAAALGSTALADDIHGDVKWTDSAGATHAARRVKVVVAEENPMLGSTIAAVLDADLDGHYSSDVFFRPGATGYSVFVVAQNDAGYVTADGAVTGRYAYPGGFRFRGTAGPLDVTVDNASTPGQAFQIADAMYTSWRWGVDGRSAGTPPGPVPAQFPVAGTVPYWDGTKLNLVAGGQNDWDTAQHEHMHYLSSLDPLHNYAGAPHTFGVSHIPTLGSSHGSRLAWGEGLANWGSIAPQRHDTAGGHMPVGVPNVGDTAYDDTAQGFSI